VSQRKLLEKLQKLRELHREENRPMTEMTRKRYRPGGGGAARYKPSRMQGEAKQGKRRTSASKVGKERRDY